MVGRGIGAPKRNSRRWWPTPALGRRASIRRPSCRKCRLREYNWLSFCENFSRQKANILIPRNWTARMATGQSSDRKAAVIGSGFGGLVRPSGSKARASKRSSTKRGSSGRRAYVYHDDGFTFDAGPTVITAPHTLTDLFELTDRRWRITSASSKSHRCTVSIWSDGDRFDYVRDEATMVEQIRARSPAMPKGTRSSSNTPRRSSIRGTQARRPPLPPFLGHACGVSSLMRLRADRSVYNTVAKYVKDDHLRQALSFHSLLVGEPSRPHPSTPDSLPEREWGVYFPEGGTHAWSGPWFNCTKNWEANLGSRRP